MNSAPLGRRAFPHRLAAHSVAAGAGVLAAPLLADEADGLREPVHRVAKADNPMPMPMGEAPHTLDEGLALANSTLARIRTGIVDYTATIVKRERLKDQLGGYEFMFAKIRNRKMDGDKIVMPLSVYLHFLKPDSVKGREVMWIEGQNNNKLRAHEGGFLGGKLPSVWLDPEGPLAMRGNLHPIYDIGIEIQQLLEQHTAVIRRHLTHAETGEIPGLIQQTAQAARAQIAPVFCTGAFYGCGRDGHRSGVAALRAVCRQRSCASV